MEISISGKEAQTIGSNAELLVDAESYLIDPDNENKEVEYQFSCAVKGEVVDETRIITVPTDSGKLVLRYTYSSLIKRIRSDSQEQFTEYRS